MVLEKTLESPLDCKEIKPVNPKGNQPWIRMKGLRLKLQLQYFGHLMQRADSLAKPLMLGKIDGREKGTTEDEMVGWNHWHNYMSLSQLREIVKDRNAWRAAVHGELNTTEQLNHSNRRYDCVASSNDRPATLPWLQNYSSHCCPLACSDGE